MKSSAGKKCAMTADCCALLFLGRIMWVQATAPHVLGLCQCDGSESGLQQYAPAQSHRIGDHLVQPPAKASLLE